jgi:hypothetical protein
MVLAKTGNNAVALGLVKSAVSVGFTLGGALAVSRFQFKRRIDGVFAPFFLFLIAGLLVGATWDLPYWIIGTVISTMIIPYSNSNFLAIIQAKVPQDMQGRFFGIDNFISFINVPLAHILIGWVGDAVMEPAMQPGGWLENLIGDFMGVGPGAGYGTLILLGGGLLFISSLIIYQIPQIRDIEIIMPDVGA